MVIGELARALGAELVGGGGDAGGAVVEGLAIDSRVLRPGQLFAALVAERDGHDYVPAAVAAGAGACLVERADPVPPGSVPGLVVPSVGDALASIAVFARERLDATAAGRVVGVTGSVGKTTTKDLLASVLAERWTTAASERSFNNELGVPLTLANAPDGTEAAVIEMGARGHGHIRTLCELARPTVGVVTLVAAVHSEFMGGVERIMLAKRELVECLPSDGVAVLNADDARVRAMSSSTSASTWTYSALGDPTAEVGAERVALDDELRPSFDLWGPSGREQVRLGVRGEHNVANALAAASAALALGATLGDVSAGLARPDLSPWRMELGRTRDGLVVLNDAYNANPTSMVAALRALAALDARRRVAVLGLMAELGSDEAAEHAAVADAARQLGVEVLVVGTDLYGVAPLGSVDEAVDSLAGLSDGDAVLVKASRSAGLEQVAARLMAR